MQKSVLPVPRCILLKAQNVGRPADFVETKVFGEFQIHLRKWIKES